MCTITVYTELKKKPTFYGHVEMSRLVFGGNSTSILPKKGQRASTAVVLCLSASSGKLSESGSRRLWRVGAPQNTVPIMR